MQTVLGLADCVALFVAEWCHNFCDDCGSNSGHIVVSILIDLHEFWTYENREVLLPDATAAAAMMGPEASTKI